MRFNCCAAIIFAFVLTAVLTPLLRAADIIPQLSEFRDGKWQVIEGASSQPAAVESDPQLNAVEDVINQGRYKEARDRLVPWLKANRTSALHDRGLYLMAETQYRLGDRIKAFYYLDELMDLHPESPLFYAALTKQYEIADSYLNGYKRRVLGVFHLGAEEEAVEMLFRIQARSPGSDLAEKALLRTADYYYSDSQFDLAADAYGEYIRRYARSALIPRVKLRQAFSNLAQFRGLKFDPTPVINARAQLMDLAAQYPQVAQDENIPSLLDRIDATFAKKLYVTADFYKRTHEPRAAAYVYSYLVSAYPDSPEAERAKVQLLHLPAPLVSPPPPTTNPMAAAF